MRISHTVIGLFVVAGLVGGDARGDVTQLVIFGDSLSDNGNTLARTVQNPSYTDRPTHPWYSVGHWTNGPDNTGPGTPQTQTAQGVASGMWHERLASQLGIPVAANSLSGPGARNYSFGGAVSGAGMFAPASLHVGSQFQQYRGAPLADAETTLFAFWGGSNDLLNAAFAPGATPASILAAADTSVNNIQGYISTLKAVVHPGQTVQVLWPNVPPLDLLPGTEGLTPALRTALGEASIRFSTLENDAIVALSATPGLVVFGLDVHSLFVNVIAGQDTMFQPADATSSIIIVPNFGGLGFNPFRNLAEVPAGVDPDTYVFWDQVHPTARMHQAIGDFAASVVPSPSSFVLGMLILASGAQRSRRRSPSS